MVVKRAQQVAKAGEGEDAAEGADCPQRPEVAGAAGSVAVEAAAEMVRGRQRTLRTALSLSPLGSGLLGKGRNEAFTH